MPRRDGTGPMGNGCMNGKGLGSCAGGNTARRSSAFSRVCNNRRGKGQGMSLGNGCQRSLGRNFVGQSWGMTDKASLSEQKEFLQRRLESIDRQLQNS